MINKNQHLRIMKVIDFIENHLDSDVLIKDLAQLAYYSEFHFCRIFQSCTGESIYAFKKRLLLERSVKHLLYSEKSMTEIAFDCGYESQSSFNKSFKKYYSLTPSEVRSQKILVKNNQLTKLIVRNKMIPIIKNLKQMNVISARAKGDYATSSSKAWGKIMKFAYSNKLMNKQTKMIGISHDDPNVTPDAHIRYDACLDLNTKLELADGLKSQTIAGGQYAVFLHKGSYQKLANSYSYIFSDWLSECKYKLRDLPCFEMYLNRDPRRTKPENLKTEIYIPIQ